MTLDEFLELANDGVVVECSNVKQRREVLELFDEYGYNVGPSSRSYLRQEGDSDVAFMNPGFRPSKGYVTCFRTIHGAMGFVAHAIKYEDVREIIENPPPLDERSNEEFDDDFASLMR